MPDLTENQDPQTSGPQASRPQTSGRTGAGLKLRAETTDDLTIFSAVLQDAVTVMADMTFLPRERRFAVMANRYLWEQSPGGDAAGPARATDALCQRIRTGFHFECVMKAHLQGLSQRAKAKVLELLAIQFTPDDGDGVGGIVSLLFAGGGAVHLEVECIDGYLSDIGAPWTARCRPAHAALDATS